MISEAAYKTLEARLEGTRKNYNAERTARETLMRVACDMRRAAITAGVWNGREFAVARREFESAMRMMGCDAE